MSGAVEAKRAARFYVSRFYPMFDALVHDAQGHLIKFRRGRVVCSHCFVDLGPDTPEQAEREYLRWVRSRE